MFEGVTAMRALGYRDSFDEVRVLVSGPDVARAREIVDRYFGEEGRNKSSDTEANE